MFNTETTTVRSEGAEITGYIDMFISYLTKFLEAIKEFLAKLGINLGGAEETTAQQ